jgi:hypothetical protein
MRWTEEEECDCNYGVINFNFRSVRFIVNNSRMELRCRKCNRMVGWWHTFTEKIMPLRQTWSEVERKAMR